MFGSPLSDSKMKVLKFLVDLESAADVLKYQPIITYISNYGIFAYKWSQAFGSSLPPLILSKVHVL